MIADRDYFVVALLLCVALAFGGAGYYYPRLELGIELAALGTISYFALTRRSWRFDRLTLFGFAIAAAALLLPLLQLVPLPAALWHVLPGRAFAVTLDAQLGWADKWRPLSLDPEATLRSAILLLPPAAMFLSMRFLNMDQRLNLLRLLVLFGLASALVGSVQFATGGKLTPFPSAHEGYPIGLFVNRNHQATLLLLVIPLVAAIGSLRSNGTRPPAARITVSVATCAILAVVVLATSSRMGSALLILSVGAALFLLFADQRLWRFAPPAVVGIGLIAILVFESGPFATLLARFSSLDDARFGYWADVSFALHKFGLAGTGFGTFVPVYQSAESLQHVSPSYLNHAHNDYLELALEGGVPALILLGLFAVFLALAVKNAIKPKASANRRLLAAAVACGIVVILIFSLVDYPLRMPALSTAFALLCGFLLPAPGREEAERLLLEGPVRKRRHRGRGRYAAAALVLLVAWVLIASANSQSDIIEQRYRSAVKWAPWSATAYAGEAGDGLTHRQLSRAAVNANAALAISPLQVAAIRTLGIVDLASGFEATGDQLMLTAAGLGWRDPITQLWAVQASLRSEEPAKAAQRMQALLQQGDLPPSILSVLAAPNSSPAMSALAAGLSGNDRARDAVLKLAAQAQPSEFAVFEQLLERMSVTRRPPTAEEAEPFVRRVLELGDVARAQRVWRLPRGMLLAVNGGFDQAGPSGAPSGWSVAPGRGAALTVAVPPRPLHGPALRIYAPGLSASAASQLLLLAPGEYSVSYALSFSEGAGGALQPRIACLPAKTQAEVGADAPTVGRGWQVHRFSFAVPERDCPVQRLSLVLVNRLSTAATAWIDEVDVAPGDRGGKLR